ncbi:E3 ubiquitin-protein ligase PUB23-like [Musa acuminata AAA Group]|uniref:E3 ubiquitin-protein ligase PUB23-like n=1 Tax=Musa acuminata AAA Group TaxID=214697 RepID=UPI0031D414F9
MEGAEVPPYFLCPVSLEIMRDPVTLATGITYDRENIERWIFSHNHEICPVTKQPLPNLDVTPNHTLRRLIQAWCAANASNGVERFPTPRPPVDMTRIAALLDEARLPQTQVTALGKLKAIVAESDRNRRCVESSGAVDVLASIIERSVSNSTDLEEVRDGVGSSSATDEAFTILCSLQLSDKSLLGLLQRDDNVIESLTKVLERSSYPSRAYSLLLLKSLLSVVAPARLLSLREELFRELTKVLRDQISYQATKAALHALGAVCPWGQNRLKAVQAGAVRVLIELLLDEPEKRMCEMILGILHQLCTCAEGRAELIGHAAGIAVVSKKMHRVSQPASRMAVKILYTVAKSSPSLAVLHEMLQVGAVSKLCLMLQMDCDMKAKEKIQGILRLHSKVWRNSPCLIPRLRASYPSL